MDPRCVVAGALAAAGLAASAHRTGAHPQGPNLRPRTTPHPTTPRTTARREPRWACDWAEVWGDWAAACLPPAGAPPQPKHNFPRVSDTFTVRAEKSFVLHPRR